MNDSDEKARSVNASAGVIPTGGDASGGISAPPPEDEAAMAAARSAALPGETVLWAGYGGGSSPIPWYEGSNLLAGVGCLISIAAAGVFLWVIFSGARPSMSIMPWVVFALPSGFVLVMVALVIGVIRNGSRLTVYAVTDQRALILKAASAEYLQSLGPEIVADIEVKHRPDGSGDVLFKLRSHGVQGPSGSVDVGGIQLGFGGDRFTAGFYGVGDCVRVADLVRATLRRAAADPLSGAGAGSSALLSIEERAKCLPKGDLELTTKHAAGCGIFILVISALTLAFGMLAGAGVLPVQVGSDVGPSHPVEPGVVREYALLISAGLAVIGLLVAFWRNRVVLHMDTRTYEGVRGFIPFLDKRAGTFEDFDRLELKREPARSEEGPSWLWNAYLVWKKAGARKAWRYKLHSHADHGQALALATRSGRGFGIGVVDASAEYHSSRWRRYWFPAVIVLVVLNSLLGGVHWRDEWTDLEGYRCVRRIYGCRLITTYEKADGKRGYSESEWYFFYSSSSSIGWRSSGGDGSGYRWGFGFGRFDPPSEPRNTHR